MEKTVIQTKDNLINNINSLFSKLDTISKDLDIREEKLNKIKSEIDNKHQDINSFKKVSFIANLNKQLENKNSHIELLERRITSLTKQNDKLNNKIKILKENPKEISAILETEEELIIEDAEDDKDIWLVREFDGEQFLLNSETNKVHLMLKNESPGNIIGRITSKNKFKKYNEAREYC
tara:strand:+ start:128 stop:664 length:537 start_codon:yes stop_codon:yes gene_type:complete